MSYRARRASGTSPGQGQLDRLAAELRTQPVPQPEPMDNNFLVFRPLLRPDSWVPEAQRALRRVFPSATVREEVRLPLVHDGVLTAIGSVLGDNMRDLGTSRMAEAIRDELAQANVPDKVSAKSLQPSLRKRCGQLMLSLDLTSDYYDLALERSQSMDAVLAAGGPYTNRQTAWLEKEYSTAIHNRLPLMDFPPDTVVDYGVTLRKINRVVGSIVGADGPIVLGPVHVITPEALTPQLLLPRSL